MHLTRQKFLASMVGLGFAGAARAEASLFTRPIRLILSTSPGGGADVTARLIAPRITERLGQSIVIESRAGGSGLIAGGYVAQQPPDGHTFLFDITTHAVNPVLGRPMPYKILEDLVPVTQVSRAANALAVHPSTPVNTVAEYVAYVKARQGTLSYASSGNGSAQHLGMEIFKAAAGLEMPHVPYRGGGPALVDLMAGHVFSSFAFIPSSTPHIREGRLKALATTGSTRSASFPDLPTIAESGYPDFENYDWNGIFAPARTPEPMIRQMQAAVAAALSAPDIRARFAEMGNEPVGSTPEEFRGVLKAEMSKYGDIVRKVGITVT
ncbi:Bug family tripartite tricarboxylate transporter substrate binding protein [Roseomonas xinghualingensis]|uniref:Bug family tripartite tricarboxylate transporter substrate binding protein n=1 Tax=Roseomonas xinghualingensis TaxID=2986475 RepID=UPI0021F18E72|nr:tripartite tricarboxylate transporter substrate binding protein [Roseomonas sp. SXEYE001]MCV4209921.1 tripartite tricarboxylate transporter substrate binding protein [Roseomonas sp. SXEYE001]